MIEKIYISGDMTTLKNALSSIEFLDGYTVSIDIDWTRITKEMPSASPYYYNGPEALENVEGAADTVYVVKEGDLYRLYLYDPEYETFFPTYTTSDWHASGKPKATHPATVTISDSDGHEVFRITKRWTYYDRTYMSWNIYAAGNKVVTSSCGSDSYGYYISYVYSCKNGVIIFVYAAEGNASVPIRIVRTNNGKLAFIGWRGTIVPSYSNDLTGYFQNQDCITYNDVTPFVTCRFSNRYDTHYMVVPLLTNSQVETTSYTDKSGFLPYSTQDGVIKVISINGKKHLTDSYFAIEDE